MFISFVLNNLLIYLTLTTVDSLKNVSIFHGTSNIKPRGHLPPSQTINPKNLTKNPPYLQAYPSNPLEPGRITNPKISQLPAKNQQILNKHPKQTRPSKYTKWSKWSECSDSCTTKRRKRCRAKRCRKKILTEMAFCYVDGSACHSWIQNYTTGNGPTPVFKVRKTPRSDTIAKPGTWNDWIDDCGVSPLDVAFGYQKYAGPSMKIIGGDVSPRFKWPWQVAILNQSKKIFCGGTLIHPQWILTAAHCVQTYMKVRLNEYNLLADDGEMDLDVAKVIVHERFNFETIDNDIALIKLPFATKIKHVCLPRIRDGRNMEQLCTATGWGKKFPGDRHGSTVLLEAEIPMVPRVLCQKAYVNFPLTSNMLCAGYKNGGRDTCAGDSGGPLMCQLRTSNAMAQRPWVIFGVTSFGEGCGRVARYGIYTAVANYHDWIVGKIYDG